MKAHIIHVDPGGKAYTVMTTMFKQMLGITWTQVFHGLKKLQVNFNLPSSNVIIIKGKMKT